MGLNRELFSHFCVVCAKIKIQFNVFVHTLHNDNAEENFSNFFQSSMLQNGILHKTSCISTQSQNGVVEHKIDIYLKLHMPFSSK